MPSSIQDHHWTRLLGWLADHGMDVSPEYLLVERKKIPGAGYGLFAVTECHESTRLFTVPASALLNKRTLEGIYDPTLSAVQMLSLHLALYRPRPGEDSKDNLFGPYISILPREFDSHPLTWAAKHHWEQQLSNEEQLLLNHLPPSIRISLRTMLDRFILDWKACREYHKNSSRSNPRASDSSVFDVKYPDTFLWGWLNVNTRCIYHRLYPKQANPDNITLCPILDFANHSSACPYMAPDELPARKGLSLISPKDKKVPPRDELFLRYGTHPNRKLFLEYGFVEANNAVKEVDIHDLLEDLVVNSPWSQKIRNVLESSGYWGDWTLHSTQLEPAHPSYRVIAALRLIHLLSDSGAADTRPWKDTITGLRDNISDDNEVAWNVSLKRICEAIQDRASSRLEREATPINVNTSWSNWMRGNVRMLWEEEALTARMVLDSSVAGLIQA